MAEKTQREMSAGQGSGGRESQIQRKIVRAIMRTRLILFWEDLWPRLVPLLAVAGLFALASWFGLWLVLSDWAHIAILAVFALAALASLWPLVGLRLPSRAEAFARLERMSAQPNRPATGFFDHLAVGAGDPQTRAIWEAHRAKLIADFGALRTGLPSPGLPRRDPYGLRFLLLLTLVVAFVAAGGGWLDRIADAFRGGSAFAAEEVASRIDAWAEPPAYTGVPSIFLTGTAVRAGDGPVTVPTGTQVVVRLSGDGADALGVTLAADGGDRESIEQSPGVAGGPREFSVTLDAAGRIAVSNRGRELAGWTFAVTPDNPPTIAVTSGPGRSNAGGLQVAYNVADDYGVTNAWADFNMTTLLAGSDPLYGPPEYRLVIPRLDSAEGNAVTVRDLSEHPWAGLDVTMTLNAEDALGQRATSAPYPVTLPARVFTNPVARDVVAARQTLALDAHRADEVAATIDRLATANAADLPNLGAYLALVSAASRLRYAYNDDQLRGVVDYLWDIAIAIEGDPVADAVAAMQAAADALQAALERGASDEEIAALTEQLRQAIQDYLQAAAAARDPTQQNAGQNTQTIQPEQLDNMLNQLQQYAQTGDTQGAQQLLNQLQQLMQNLNVANAQQQQIDQQPDQQAIDDLTFLLQEQQRLMDETFALQQEQNAPLPKPETADEAQQALEDLRNQRAQQDATADDLAHQQRTLRADLEQLIENFLANGQDTGQLEGAREAMGAAGDLLDQTQPGPATGQQANAIEQLRAFADQLAQQQQQTNDPQGTVGDQPPQDPLGRTPPAEGRRYGDQFVGVPDEVDTQRAREILDIIRQRLGEPDRPLTELQYLERLLGRY